MKRTERPESVVAFLIWREATRRKWKCSGTDIADAIGETSQRVNEILRRRDWRPRLEDNRNRLRRTHPFVPVDQFIASMNRDRFVVGVHREVLRP